MSATLFLPKRSPCYSTPMDVLEKIQEQLGRLLEISQRGSKAVDPISRAFSSGRVSAFEDILKLVNHAIRKEASGKIKAAAFGKQSLEG